MTDKLDNKTQKVLDTISENVVKFRKQKGYSQLGLALEIGLSGNALTRSTAPAVEPLSEYRLQNQAHITKKLLD